MSYATPEQVKSLFRNLTASQTNAALTDIEIQEFLDDADAIINAKIGTLYSLPITQGANPESFKILKRLETFKVACMIDDILNSYGEADKKPQWCRKAKELMDMLVPPIDPKTCRQCKPVMLLPDAIYLGTNTQRSPIKLSATSGTVIKKGADNW